MGTLRSTRLYVAVAVVGGLLVAGCSSGGDSSAGATSDTAGPTALTSVDARLPAEIAPPPAQGKGVNEAQPAAKLPPGYIEEEYFVGGTASSYVPVDTPNDGSWTVAPGDEAAYKTRVIVRRPADAAAFSGTALVEWFNVSALEASPGWGFMSEEMGREGDVYIGVSAQAQGVEGGKTVLDVQADQSQVDAAGVNASKSGLKSIDPERYGTLVHPGDAYAYDMFSQIGRAVVETPKLLMGDLVPKHVIAMGESQSATFLTTYINAVEPLAPVFDGFMVHSRLGVAAPLGGEFFSANSGATDEETAAKFKEGVLIRTDVQVPVMIFETETDLTFLAYSYARQPDTDRIRTWEVAGTSHADAQFIRAVIGGPRDPGVGSLLGCQSINTAPQKEVLQAALNHLVSWVAGGPPPPSGERVELSEGDTVTIVRDQNGNALGGVRHPMVDVPLASLSGEAPPGITTADLENGGSVCVLFGNTTPFDQAKIVELYGNFDAYIAQFQAAADKAVAGGFMLRPDADALVAEAEGNRSLFP